MVKKKDDTVSKNKTSKIEDFKNTFGEGTQWDLDWGKLIIIGLCIYIAFFKDF